MSTGRRISFARFRAIALSYVIFVSYLLFTICIFVLPSSGSKIPLLALVSGVSFFSGSITFFSLLGSKLSKRRWLNQVGFELIWSVCLVPIEILNTAACAAIGRGRFSAPKTDASDSTQVGPVSDSPAAARNFSVLLAAFTGSATMFLFIYVALLVTLVLYTMRRRGGRGSRMSDIWFEAVDRFPCPFFIPSVLRAIIVSDHVGALSVHPFTTALPGHPSLNDFSRPGDGAAHYCVPGCSCEGKPTPRPSRPEEYREIQRLCLQDRREAGQQQEVEKKQWSIRNILRGHKRAASAPIIPAVTIPTERDRRRSLFTVAFEVV